MIKNPRKPKKIESLSYYMLHQDMVVAKTPHIEKLGFCPECLTPMMFYAIEYNTNDCFIGRVCPHCGYESDYHQDCLGCFVKEVDEVKIEKISVWYGRLNQ